MKPYQVYDCRSVGKVTVIIAKDAFHALAIAKERGIFAPVVNASPILKGK